MEGHPYPLAAAGSWEEECFFFSGRVGAGRSFLLMQAVIPRLSGLGKRGGGDREDGRDMCWGAEEGEEGGSWGVNMIKIHCIYIWNCPRIKKY